MPARVALLAVALLAVVLFAAGTLEAIPASAQQPGERTTLPDIEDEVMCPICGTLLSLSDSPQAARERFLIRSEIAKGSSKEEIKRKLVEQYGPSVLAIPDDDTGFDLLGWALPGAGTILAIGGLGLGLRRWRREPDPGPPADSTSAAERSRLDEDLDRYDL